MKLHFYTVIEHIHEIENGNTANVWTKQNSGSSDIPVTINLEEFEISKVDSNLYMIKRLG